MSFRKSPVSWAAFVVLLASSACAQSSAPPKDAPRNVEGATSASAAFEVQLIRSATVAIRYTRENQKSITILVDPILADPHTEPAILYSNEVRNPTSALPIDKHRLIASADAILLTHYHSDHFDAEAERIVPKDMLVFCQPYDERRLREKGFSNLRIVDDAVSWQGITISRFSASHYPGATGAPPFGESSSFALKTAGDSLFVTGDAILDDRLKGSLLTTGPKTIVANTGECHFTQPNPVLTPGVAMTLTRGELREMTRLLPAAKIVAVHMDGINHCSLTKRELKRYVEAEKLSDRILVPNEGELVSASGGVTPSLKTSR